MLNNKVANKLFNSDYIKDLYPMVDRIETHVVSDEDEEFQISLNQIMRVKSFFIHIITIDVRVV